MGAFGMHGVKIRLVGLPTHKKALRVIYAPIETDNTYIII